ncbi:MAG: dihydroorotate dehydrogenase electron transfer subunit [Bacteroidetes bacterium]|nr:dihydroorotate dehydrogenase electron transfer subunit [Bacteroidota bacterium]
MSVKKVLHDLVVAKNIHLNNRHFILELQAPEPLPGLLPGQFVQLLVNDSPSTFLRRPFSIHAFDEVNNAFRLLIQIKGEGTRHLSHLKVGEKLNVMYPLGNSFSRPPGKEVLLVGGGCGVAPLLFLGKWLKEQDVNVTLLTGWKRKEDIFEKEAYQQCGEVLITTEDGSEGEPGMVTGHSIFKSGRNFDRIYCCGPDRMMKAVAHIATRRGIDCEVSLENTMACGFGVCLCCITPTNHGNQRVCMEGPVFSIKELGW